VSNKISKSAIVDAAKGRWPEILGVLASIPIEVFNGAQQPCPLCGGEDRFRYDDAHGQGDYFCNQCGASDGFKMLQEKNGWSFPQALEELARHLNIDIQDHAPPSVVGKVRKKSDVKQVVPVPDSAPAPEMRHWKLEKTPDRTWEYRNMVGQLLYIIARYDHEDGSGKKTVVPWVYGTTGEMTKPAWISKHPEHRQLWNLPEIAARPDFPVLIVEGEKAAEAAKEMFGSALVVTTWNGGSKS